jgi:hypothetical protein
MKPIETESTNLMLLPPHGQEDHILALPCTLYQTEDSVGRYDMVESCWQMTWRERIQALLHGRVWFSTYGRTHPPIRLSV